MATAIHPTNADANSSEHNQYVNGRTSRLNNAARRRVAAIELPATFAHNLAAAK